MGSSPLCFSEPRDVFRSTHCFHIKKGNIKAWQSLEHKWVSQVLISTRLCETFMPRAKTKGKGPCGLPVEPSQHFLILPVYASNCEHLLCMATTTQLKPTPCNLSTQTPKLQPSKNRCICGKTEQKANLRNTQHALEEGAAFSYSGPQKASGMGGGESMTLLSSWEKNSYKHRPPIKSFSSQVPKSYFFPKKDLSTSRTNQINNAPNLFPMAGLPWEARTKL